mmetsp:Transcript_12452/g.21534  ORF Transcript_12452/g.21534 Transcript_12452/m.21534 type:complete len:536 (-) Transcript_12452:120-1727(-)
MGNKLACASCGSRGKPDEAAQEKALMYAKVKPLPGPILSLRQLLGERLQTPDCDLYDAARGDPNVEDVSWDGKYRQTWNLDDIGFPSAIATVQTVAEVQAVVKYAAQHCNHMGMRLCIACGRHSHQSVLNDTFVLDLQRLDSVEVQADKKIAKVAGGAQQGQLDSACAPYGLATTAGHNASTGCGGLILQGGHGFLERKFGMVVDNLLAVEVVLADGRLVTASESENSDLFWAVRGGGGNFGVIVSFSLQLHPLSDVYAGIQVHAPLGMMGLPGREDLVEQFFEKTVGGPDEATGLIVLPGGGPIVEMLLWVGAPEAGKEYFESKAVGWPFLQNSMGIKKYQTEVQRFTPPGNDNAIYQSGVLLPEFPRAAIEKLAELVSGSHAPNSNSAVVLLPLGGQVSKVAPDATAYCHRNMKTWVLILGAFPPGDEEQRTKTVKWVRAIKAAMLPFSQGAQYGVLSEVATHGENGKGKENIDSNKLNESDDGGAIGCMLNTAETMGKRNIYGANLPRLQRLKAKYDPENLFRVNDNIVPMF